jgi:hypothetical protein
VNTDIKTTQRSIINGGTPERALDGDIVGIYKWGGTGTTQLLLCSLEFLLPE